MEWKAHPLMRDTKDADDVVLQAIDDDVRADGIAGGHRGFRLWLGPVKLTGNSAAAEQLQSCHGTPS